jgi:hypothetical protein
MQTNANKNKQNSFHLLPFISPNRDFSMGYERRNKNIRVLVSGCVQNVSSRRAQPVSNAFLISPRAGLLGQAAIQGGRSVIGNTYSAQF